MKTLRLLLIPVCSILVLQSCGKIDAAEGDLKTNRFEVEDFDKIRIETAGVLNYTQGAERNVEVSTNEKILKFLVVKVEDNTLVISMSKNKTITNQESLVFTVSDDNVYSIETTGSATVNANMDEGHDFEQIELISSGSGDIHLDTINAQTAAITTSGSGEITSQTVDVANNLTVVESGSGDVSISGSVYELDLNLSGSGDFGEHDFISQKVTANLSGSGSAKVSVSYQLNANLSGSGNLTFKGNPAIMATSSSGSGQVIDGN